MTEVPDWVPGTWLPEDKNHPIRPDLPWLRHLTFTEGHAIEIGVGLAVFVYYATTLDMGGAAFPVVAYLVRVAIGARTKRNKKRGCDHNLGVHDIKSDPWYFIVSAVVTVGALIAVWGPP